MTRAEVFANKVLPGGMEQTADNQIAFLRKYWRSYRRDAPIATDVARGFKVQILRAEPQLKAVGRFIKVCGDYDVARAFSCTGAIASSRSSRRCGRASVKRVSSGLGGVETAQLRDEKLAGEAQAIAEDDGEPGAVAGHARDPRARTTGCSTISAARPRVRSSWSTKTR